MGGLNIADRAGLLVAAQKGLVDAAVGLDIALQREQLAGAAVDLVHVAPGLAHGPVQVGLLGQQHLVVLFQRLDHIQDLFGHVFLGGAEFSNGCDHLRMFGAIALFELGDLALGRGSGALDSLQACVAQHGRDGFIGRRGPALQGHDLAVGGLGRGAIPAHVHQLAGQFIQFLRGQAADPLHIDQFFLVTKRLQGLFGLFQILLELGQLPGQRARGPVGHGQPALQVAVYIDLGQGVADRCGQGRIGGFKADIDELTAADRRHRKVGAKLADQPVAQILWLGRRGLGRGRGAKRQ